MGNTHQFYKSFLYGLLVTIFVIWGLLSLVEFEIGCYYFCLTSMPVVIVFPLSFLLITGGWFVFHSGFIFCLAGLVILWFLRSSDPWIKSFFWRLFLFVLAINILSFIIAVFQGVI